MDDLTTITPVTNSDMTSIEFRAVILFAAIFPAFPGLFDILLLAAVIHNRRDTTLPLAYMAVMCITGIVTSLVIIAQWCIFLILSPENYQLFLVNFGRELTLSGTWSYLTAFFISLLMTVHRVIVIIRPFHTDYFSQARIFVYCGIIAILMLISMLIPYFSPCHVTFNVNKLAFVSGCAPERHPITTFQNKYAIIVPFSCMFANLGLIVHLRFFRNGTYKKISNFFGKSKHVNTAVIHQSNQTNALSKLQARRDLIMMRQTVSVAVFFSIYEFGAFLIRIFPNEFADLPKTVRDGIFFFRLLSVPMLNFIIYYVETGSTRRMFRRYLGIPEQGADSNGQATVVTVAPKGPTVRIPARIPPLAAAAAPVA